MDPVTLSLLLLAVAVVLLVGELLLPTHGVLGLAGLACLAGAVGATFFINRWLGLGVTIVAVLGSPFIWAAGIRLWETSPVGRRIILQPMESMRRVIPVKLGQVGVAVTDMRPMGECEFEEVRLSASSDRGIIRAGEKVKVVAVVNGIPTVRAVRSESVPETAV